ncbi:MAG: peptidase T, partial [Anaerolineaceae bacterium]|nr:peptidase T [Anaerolineaceae bacterium]
MSDVIDRFVRYVQINTKSDHESDSFPSTKEQFDLAKLLENE